MAAGAFEGAGQGILSEGILSKGCGGEAGRHHQGQRELWHG
jgi:hypothetical protein